jgi:nucleotide-binding universal stress UspA family protein
MNIVYATDGSEGAATAGRLLASLPLPTGAKVTVLSAVPESAWVAAPPVGAEGSFYPLLAEVAAEEQSAALKTAETAVAPLRERGLAVAASVRRRSPADAILEQAQEDGASLIVVGSHGRGAVERFLLGSVSERVARYAHCSVLVARGDSVSRAVLAVDDSESSEHALEALLHLPLPKSMAIKAVHVLRPLNVTPPLQLGPGASWESAMQQYDEQLQGVGLRITRHAQDRLRAAGREVEVDVRCGAAADELIAAARDAGADLIIAGAANRSALGRLFLGSVSGRLLSHAPCSVLIARSALHAADEEPASARRVRMTPHPAPAA